MMHFQWIRSVGIRQVLLPMLALGLIFIISSRLISQRVDLAIQSYQDAYLSLSAGEYRKNFDKLTESYRNHLKVLAIRPEVGEGQFVIRAEGNHAPLGKLLRQEMAAVAADHIRAVDRKGALLFAHGELDFVPESLLTRQMATIQSHPPIQDPQRQLDEVVHSQLVYTGNRFHLLSIGPLLDVEDIVGVIILVHSLDAALLTRLRDEMQAHSYAGADPFAISLATRHKVVHSTQENLLDLPLPNAFPQPFDQTIAGRTLRHVPLPIHDSTYYLILSSASAVLGGLHAVIRWILVGVFVTVLLLLLIITLFNIRQIRMRQQARDAQEREERFRRLADAALEGIVFSDGPLILDVNPAFAEMFGYSISELTGLAILDLVAPEQHAWVESKLQDSSQEMYEVLCLRRDQSSLLVEVRSRPIEYGNRTVRVTAVRDVTQRKWAEERLREAKESAERAYQTLKTTQKQLVQAEKFASLGQLVAGVAHEINTPVGIGVTGASHLAQETKRMQHLFDNGTIRKADFREYIGMVGKISDLLLTNMQRASGLIQSFKQVAVDRTSADRRSFDVKNYLEEILSSLHPRLKKTPHQVEIVGESGILADSFPGAFAQIMTNLLLNALLHAFDEHSPNGGVIRIQVERGQREEVLVTLSDNGQGIPPENLGKVFDPFFTTRRGSGGSGLGLHISYNLAQQTLGG
ncbi:MAG: PAS domain S-box protein [Magnetococcus sp. YQC-3]